MWARFFLQGNAAVWLPGSSSNWAQVLPLPSEISLGSGLILKDGMVDVVCLVLSL
jgi:hypothetical protein